MRLLVLSELFLPTKGGTAVWAAEVYPRLGGKEIHIVTANVPGAYEIDVMHPNSIHRLNLRRVRWLRPESLGMYVRFFLKSIVLAFVHRPGGIHAFRALPEGFVAWAVARLTLRRVVVYAHGEELVTWGRGAKFKTMRFTLRHADRVIANSEFTRDELLKIDVPPERIVLIYPGVDIDRFRPGLPCDDLKAFIGLQPGEKVILSVGRLSRRKGFDMVIRSLPRLLGQGIRARYALIGIGDDRDYLAELAHKLGVQDRVHLLGHVDQADLPRWYNACDVFAMPNRDIDGDTEGFGIVFLEAAACGKAVIAGISGGTGAAVIEGVTGLRVDAQDEAAVTTSLLKLCGSDEERLAMGLRAFERVMKTFTWHRVALQTQLLAA